MTTKKTTRKTTTRTVRSQKNVTTTAVSAVLFDRWGGRFEELWKKNPRLALRLVCTIDELIGHYGV